MYYVLCTARKGKHCQLNYDIVKYKMQAALRGIKIGGWGDKSWNQQIIVIE